jgi:peptide methionine sulfoxide reductase msrA/msrB
MKTMKILKEIYLAGGCFWGVEKYLSLIPGVAGTQAGYANGRTEAPLYEEVCFKNTGHAETVKVIYDPEVLDLSFLLELFYEAVDPVSVNRQGHDAGTQYRTGVYYTDEKDFPVIEASLAGLREKCRLHDKRGKPVAIEAKLLENYYPAEEYHQKYLDKNPGGYCHIGSGTFRNLRAALADRAAAGRTMQPHGESPEHQI